MGMTIETDIKILQSRKEEALEEGYKGFASALGNAIATMRKYQKVEEIYQKWNEVNDFSYNQAMQQIGEVLEDGNDN